jgi:hypothetical protein
VLVTGPGCALCEPAKRALRAAGAQPHTHHKAAHDPTTVAGSPLPVARVIGRDGTILIRRTGRAVFSDAGRIAGQLATAT